MLRRLLIRARNSLRHRLFPPTIAPRTITPQAAAQAKGAHYTEIYPAHTLSRTPPHQLGATPLPLTARIRPDMPPCGVIALPNPVVYSDNGWIFTADGRALEDCSWYRQRTPGLRVPRRRPTPTPLPGLSVSIASDFAAINYAHFTLDCLGRIHLLQAAGVDLQQIDHFLCPRPSPANLQRLAQLGVPLDRCLWLDADSAWQPEHLIATTFPGLRYHYLAWLPHFLREELTPKATSAPRRLYVVRAGRSVARRIVNDHAIQQIALNHRLELYDPARADDQAVAFANADVVVGPHSAGLANLAFCQPGTRVLEILPTDHCIPYYYTLAESAGLHYHYLAGQSLGRRAAGDRSPSKYDFTVNEAEFDAALTHVLSQPARPAAEALPAA